MSVAYPNETRQGLQECLSREGFPSAKATLQDKEVFLKGVVG